MLMHIAQKYALIIICSICIYQKSEFFPCYFDRWFRDAPFIIYRHKLTDAY